MKGLHCQTRWKWNIKPCAAILARSFDGVHMQYTPSDNSLHAAVEVTMKNMDVFNTELVCLLLLLLLLFKLGFAEYSKHVYILKEKLAGVDFWLVSFCCGVFLSGLNGNTCPAARPQTCTVLWLHSLEE